MSTPPSHLPKQSSEISSSVGATIRPIRRQWSPLKFFHANIHWIIFVRASPSPPAGERPEPAVGGLRPLTADGEGLRRPQEVPAEDHLRHSGPSDAVGPQQQAAVRQPHLLQVAPPPHKVARPLSDPPGDIHPGFIFFFKGGDRDFLFYFLSLYFDSGSI